MQSDPAGNLHGRWVLTSKGQPHDYSYAASRFGLQPSGLAWDAELLWGISDQSSSCPGCLFMLHPEEIGEEALLLQEDALPITHRGEILPFDGGQGSSNVRKKAITPATSASGIALTGFILPLPSVTTFRISSSDFDWT